MKLTRHEINNLRKQGADYVLGWREKPSMDAAIKMANNRVGSLGEEVVVGVAEHIYKGMLAAAKRK